MKRLAIVIAVGPLLAMPLPTVADGIGSPSWLQWGGPSRDFQAPAGELATSWPEGGPEKLWSRPLGEGHSAVLFEEDRLYTMHRIGENEVVICLDAATGETIWERAYKVEYQGLTQYGTGPRSTPLLVGDRLFTVGATGRMHALDKRDGKVLWSRELWGDEFDGNRLGHGYASSPLAYRDTVIGPVGGLGAALVAFDQKSGEVRWQAHSFRNSYSSPSLLTIAGEEQLVVFMAEELISVDPANGVLRWSWPHVNQWGHNITMPAVDGDIIFFSSPQAGARGLRLVPNGEGFEPEQVWSTRRIQFYHAATVQEGSWVYGSTGLTSPAFMTAVDIRTGKVAWKKRGFAKANCVEADGRLVILDENGVLYLAEATLEELTIRAQARLLDRYAWSVPTIVGQTMYVRDQGQILAVDLG
jgi:outer membrane protein assembly factor BamB